MGTFNATPIFGVSGIPVNLGLPQAATQAFTNNGIALSATEIAREYSGILTQLIAGNSQTNSVLAFAENGHSSRLAAQPSTEAPIRNPIYYDVRIMELDDAIAKFRDKVLKKDVRAITDPDAFLLSKMAEFGDLEALAKLKETVIARADDEPSPYFIWVQLDRLFKSAIGGIEETIAEIIHRIGPDHTITKHLIGELRMGALRARLAAGLELPEGLKDAFKKHSA